MQQIIDELVGILKKHKDRFEYAAEQQIKLWNGEKPEKQPLLLTCAFDKARQEKIPLFNTKEIHYDSEKMLVNGLRETMTVVNGGRGSSVREGQHGLRHFPHLAWGKTAVI